MSGAFISYSGGRIDRAVLFYALRDYGLRPWRDVESLDLGDVTPATIDKELERCSSAVLWVNDDVLRSDFVTRLELPAIARAVSRNGLRLVPVFDGLSPSEGSERVSKESGIEIGESNGHVVDSAASQQETATRIASRLARAELRRGRDERRLPVIRLISYTDAASLRDDAVLSLDWRHHFADDVLQPDSELILRKALLDVARNLIEVYGPQEITLAIKAHLPLAIAIGHAFAQPTGCTIQFPRDGDSWRTEVARSDADLLLETAAPAGPVSLRVSSVEASVSRDVEAGATAFVKSRDRFRHRIRLRPNGEPSRDSVADGVVANAWGRQIAEVVARVKDSGDADSVALFLAAPVEVAAIVGWWLNAAGPVDLMNWSGRTGPYVRMWSLP